MTLRIQTLRGLACVLLVLYHVVGADASSGLRIEGGALRWFNDALAYLRMPLFTFLSGLVYGLRPFSGNSRTFLMGKVRRLLIPMLVVGTLFALLQSWKLGANATLGPWYLLHVLPVAHFWFLESFFWVFLLIWALERWNLIGKPKGYLLTFVLACGVYLNVGGWYWFSIAGAIYLLPYFLFGLAFSRFPLQVHLANPWVRFGLLSLATVAVVSIGMPVPNQDRQTLAILVAGISLCALSLSLRWSVPWLERIGSHSYAIYLFHIFFTAPVRIGMHALDVNGLAPHILTGLLVGLMGPVLLDRMASGFKWPALLLLGKSAKPSAITVKPLLRAL